MGLVCHSGLFCLAVDRVLDRLLCHDWWVVGGGFWHCLFRLTTVVGDVHQVVCFGCWFVCLGIVKLSMLSCHGGKTAAGVDFIVLGHVFLLVPANCITISPAAFIHVLLAPFISSLMLVFN